MNRFDRVTSLWLLLQTRSVVTAGFLAEHFGVSERTVYRDIRTLENAGVPIGAEVGVGYYLDRSYRLPPVSFTLDEASALLLGEKLAASSLDQGSLQDFKQALNKIRSVVDQSEKDHLSALDDDVEVIPTGSHFPIEKTSARPDGTAVSTHPALSGDRWLRECRTALMHRNVIDIHYQALEDDRTTSRSIEPIGLFYYSWHWHMIGWCRLRSAYRDFRLDRINSLENGSERFARNSRLTLQQYLDDRPGKEEFHEIVVQFAHEAARFVGEQRYLFGFVDEQSNADGVRMRFLTPMPDYMARWLLQYLDQVEVLAGDAMRASLRQYADRLGSHWCGTSRSS